MRDAGLMFCSSRLRSAVLRGKADELQRESGALVGHDLIGWRNSWLSGTSLGTR